MNPTIPSTTNFNGKKIEDLRILNGLTLIELSRRIECDPSSVSLWERNKRRPNVVSLKKIAEFFRVPISTFFVSMIFCLNTSPAHADVSAHNAIQTIVGEASGQGLDGMIAVGEVLRRRGSVKGFYGFKAMEKRKEPQAQWDMAKIAWERSRTSNLTRGATLFENIEAFGFPKSWNKSKVKFVTKIKDHSFFREI